MPEFRLRPVAHIAARCACRPSAAESPSVLFHKCCSTHSFAPGGGTRGTRTLRIPSNEPVNPSSILRDPYQFRPCKSVRIAVARVRGRTRCFGDLMSRWGSAAVVPAFIVCFTRVDLEIARSGSTRRRRVAAARERSVERSVCCRSQRQCTVRMQLSLRASK